MVSTNKENDFVLVTDENFDEQAYLASNPDVAKAVQDGIMVSGKVHFEQYGRAEKRKMEARHLPSRFSRGVNSLFSVARKVKSVLWNPQSGMEKTSASGETSQDEFFMKRQAIANEFIRGVGIEIGALHHPLPVPENTTVRYVDRLNAQQLREQYPELSQLPIVDVDIIADGERLESIPNSSQDFVIANHFLEHCQNPLFAIENMIRVLKPNGIVFMGVPDKRFTFDIDRPLTTYEHLENDYKHGGEFSKKQHFEEWVRLVHHVTDELEVAKQANHLMEIDYSIHFHVWTQMELMEMVLNLKRRLAIELELLRRNNNEVIIVLRKLEGTGT